MILEQISDNYLWILVLILIVNLGQRKIPDSDRKRFATIWLCVIMMIFEIGIVFILTKNLSHHLAWILVALCLAIAVIFRKKVWPFRLHCRKCHGKLDWNHIIGHDDNLCQECHDEAHPEEAARRREKERESREAPEPPVIPDKVEEMDWDAWDPGEITVLTYLFDGERVLLIEKKRGLGSGLVSAPGGHVELEETTEEAARRELREETGLTIRDVREVGILRFQFKDGLSERTYVFTGEGFEGELKECEEAKPFWAKKEELPYERMWEDDKLWLPLVISGRKFRGTFIFDGQKMLDAKMESEEDE